MNSGWRTLQTKPSLPLGADLVEWGYEMSKEVSRTVSALACTTTLSLFFTVFTFAAVHAAQLRLQGVACSAQPCAPTMLAAAQGRSAKPHIAAFRM
jgi:hypothetical protein